MSILNQNFTISKIIVYQDFPPSTHRKTISRSILVKDSSKLVRMCNNKLYGNKMKLGLQLNVLMNNREGGGTEILQLQFLIPHVRSN